LFEIHQIKENGHCFLELKNAENTTVAKISLDEGGSLQVLKLENEYIIKTQPNFKYQDSYASSILFPFAGRIEAGNYLFQEQKQQLKCNEAGKNAIHGLVYNQQFRLIEKTENEDFSLVTIGYTETQESEGFPFTYNISITYRLSKDEINIAIKVVNTDIKPFPFTLGWHPYFVSDALYNSSLNFKSDKKIEFDENLITKRVIEESTKGFKIENKQLDTCFILNSNTIAFKTPKYQIQITTDQKENYLQIYTPKNRAVIAIEPMTGVSNSFNNKIGLQILEPKKEYQLKWTVTFIKTANKNE
jgi:aldose 1-epimerase